MFCFTNGCGERIHSYYLSTSWILGWSNSNKRTGTNFSSFLKNFAIFQVQHNRIKKFLKNLLQWASSDIPRRNQVILLVLQQSFWHPSAMVLAWEREESTQMPHQDPDTKMRRGRELPKAISHPSQNAVLRHGLFKASYGEKEGHSCHSIWIQLKIHLLNKTVQLYSSLLWISTCRITSIKIY